jgi:hypothetical protein
VRILPAIAFALLITAVAAPAAAFSGKLGVQLAGVSNQLTGELPDEGNWTSRSGLGYGLVFDWNIAPDIALSLQPGVTPRHSRQEFKSGGQVIGRFDYDINYFSLPLLLRVTGDPVGVRGFVTAGLDLGFLMDASLDTGADTEDITDQFNDRTIGALFGAGVMVPLGRNHLTFELRYCQGLNDMITRDGDEAAAGFASPSIKYRSISLLAGFLFSLGGE